MTEELMKELVEAQREANRWLRVLALPTLANALRETLSTGQEKRIYQASTGGTSREVAEGADTTHTTVLRYWRQWAASGLVEQVAPGRYARLVDLSELGIEVEDNP